MESLLLIFSFLGSKSFFENILATSACDLLKKSKNLLTFIEGSGLKANHDLENVYSSCLIKALKLLDKAVKRKAKEIGLPETNYAQFHFSVLCKDEEKVKDFLNRLDVDVKDILNTLRENDAQEAFKNALHNSLLKWTDKNIPKHAKDGSGEEGLLKLHGYIKDYICNGFPNPGSKKTEKLSFYDVTSRFFMDVLKNPKTIEEHKAKNIFKNLQSADISKGIDKILEEIKNSKSSSEIKLGEEEKDKIVSSILHSLENATWGKLSEGIIQHVSNETDRAISAIQTDAATNVKELKEHHSKEFDRSTFTIAKKMILFGSIGLALIGVIIFYASSKSIDDNKKLSKQIRQVNEKILEDKEVKKAKKLAEEFLACRNSVSEETAYTILAAQKKLLVERLRSTIQGWANDVVNNENSIDEDLSLANSVLGNYQLASEFEEERTKMLKVRYDKVSDDVKDNEERLNSIKLELVREHQRLAFSKLELTDYVAANKNIDISFKYLDENNQAIYWLQGNLIKARALKEIGDTEEAIAILKRFPEYYRNFKGVDYLDPFLMHDIFLESSELNIILGSKEGSEKALVAAKDVITGIFISDPVAVIKHFWKSGEGYRDLGNEKLSILNYKNALKMYEEYEKSEEFDSTTLPKFTEVYLLGNIGNTYSNLGHFEDSLNYALKALKILKANLPDENPKVLDYMFSVAHSLYNLDRYGEALDKFERVLKVMKKLESKDVGFIIYVEYFTGATLLRLKRYNEAVSHLKIAYEFYQKKGFEETAEKLRCYIVLGEISGQVSDENIDRIKKAIISMKKFMNLGSLQVRLLLFETLFDLSAKDVEKAELIKLREDALKELGKSHNLNKKISLLLR